jgi:hypothetical protein
VFAMLVSVVFWERFRVLAPAGPFPIAMA